MSKTFWGIVMFFSLVITGWAGFFLYNEIQPREPMEVPLEPVTKAPEPPPPVTTSTETVASVVPNANELQPSVSTGNIVIIDEPPSIHEAKKTLENKVSKSTSALINGKRDVAFSLKKPEVKKAFLVGEFNKWFRQPMKREGDNWNVSLKIAPGTYQYLFVIEDGKQTGSYGKRIKDPSNKQSSKDGKFSLLVVEK